MPFFAKMESVVPVPTEENKHEVLPGRLFRDPFDQRVFNKFLVDGMLAFCYFVAGLDLANDRDDGCFCARIEFSELDVTIYHDMSVF